MDSVFVHHCASLGNLFFFILIPFLLIEGEIVLFTAAYLAHVGCMNIFVLVPVAFFTTSIGDFLWFKFGKYLENKPFFKRFVHKISGPVDEQLKNHPMRTILIAKFAYGTFRATVVRAGGVAVPVRKFVEYDLFANFLWVGLIISLGYGSSASADYFKQHFKYAEIGLLLGIVVIYVIFNIFKKMSLKKA